jgi:hypothetical protein
MEAAIARYAGYQVTFSEADKQWAIKDPGDLNDLWNDVRGGKQGIADALKLLKVYDELLAQKNQPSNDAQDWKKFVEHSDSEPSATMPSTETPEVRPTRRGSDREWLTTDMRIAIFVLYAGYKLLRTELFYSDAGREKTRFVFSGDSNLPAVIQKFRNERLLLVEAQAFHDAGFTIRGAMREMKGQV